MVRTLYRPSGRERSKTFPRRIDAERFIIETESAKAGGSWVDPRAGSRPFGELAEEILTGRIDLRAASRARDASYMRRHVLPRFGALPLSRITRQDVQEWVNDLSTKLAPATVHGCHRLLSGVFREAVEARLISQSPSRKVRLPRLSRTEQGSSPQKRSSASPTRSPPNTAPSSTARPTLAVDGQSSSDSTGRICICSTDRSKS